MNPMNGSAVEHPVGQRVFSAGMVLRLPVYLWYFLKCLVLFKDPFSFWTCYVKGTSPASGKLVMRNGLEIFLSDHPHDVRTAFVVFVKNDYGKVDSGSVVLDFGANIGVFALYAAYRGAQKIYAFEPNRKNHDVLVRNIEANGLGKIISADRRAVSPVAGQKVKFSLSPGPYNQILTGDNGGNDYELVDTTSLEAILSDNALHRVDLLKADCEGAEYDILLNAGQAAFSGIQNIKIEFHRWPIDGLVSHLKKFGYECVFLDRENAVAWFEREGAR